MAVVDRRFGGAADGGRCASDRRAADLALSWLSKATVFAVVIGATHPRSAGSVFWRSVQAALYHEWMVPNPRFWAYYCREFHVPVVQAFRSAALKRVVTAFGGLAEEAEAAAEAEFERLGSTVPVDAGFDMGDVAEWAQDYGIKYYETISGIQQGVQNLLAVGLYHLFEQQQLLLLRRAIARYDDAPSTVSELERRLIGLGIDCRNLRSAGKVYELRKAANAIKHGPGPAATELAKLRPDLFENPVLATTGVPKGPASRSEVLASSLSAPLAGEDLYVSERDLSDWCTAVVDYWQELSTFFDELHRRQADG